MKKTKNIIRASAIAIVAAVLLNACRPEVYAPVGTVTNHVQQMAGTWKLAAVTQEDLLAARYNFVDPSRPGINLITQDVTSVAPYTDFSLTLNEDASNTPSTYAVSYGNSPKLIKDSTGSWKVDNAQYPQNIKLFKGTDTTTFTLSGLTALANNQLTVQVTRYQDTKAVILYTYTFNKIK